MRPYAWRLYLVVVGAVAAVYFLVPNTPISKLLLYNGIGLSAVSMIFLGIRRNAPAVRRPWLLIAMGQISFLTADVVYYVLEAVTGTTPFPSPADLFFLGMYPFLIAGLLGLFRQISPGRDLASIVDALLVAVATFAVLGILVMDTYLADPTLDTTGRFISLAYPVMDVLVLAVAARLVASIQLRNPSFALLAAGVTSLLIADTIYGILNSAGAFQTGGFADAFWLGFYVLLASAALHPAMAAPVPARPITPGRITMARLAVLCLVTLAVPVIDLIWGEPFDKILTTTASMMMFVLVLARLMGLMHTIQSREAQARHESLHDPLTGLANRVLFADRLGDVLDDSRGRIVAVLFIDLDDFKTVNDSMGHNAGDLLLQEVSRRLASCVRPVDTVARLGGDEFAVLLASAVDRQDAVATAHRLLQSLAEPIPILDRAVAISASVGIAVEPREATTVEDLLRGADAAMYGAKESGKGRFEFFDQHRHAEAVDRLELRRDLHSALDAGEFEIHYQPIFDVSTTQIVKVEALLRWNHPVRGLVMPDDFVGLAEQSGLIVPIGQWVLREASAQVRRWSQQFGRRLGVAVNLSVRQLHHPGLLEDVAEALRLSGLAPECLTLEITESMLIGDAERGARALEQLKALKVRIAIDDFGTGYSSLSYLSRFPFDTIKIDRSFVRELANSATSEALVRTVITLARSLGMTTVAEGVEDRDQLRALRRLEGDLAQGFFFSRAVSATELEALLETPPPALASASVLRPSALLPSQRTARSRRLDVEIHDGQEALWDLWAGLDDLHASTGVPLMARTSWLDVWADVNPDWTPRAVVVRERGHARIEGAALLARRLADDVTEIVAMGHGWGANTVFPIRSPRVARPLAKAVTAQLAGAGGPARLELQQVVEGDAVVALLTSMLPGSQLLTELPVPRVVVQPGDSMDSLLSRNLRRQLRKARNRIETDGVAMELTFDASLVGLDTHLEPLMNIHRRRDHDTGRASDLDDPNVRRLWRELLVRHCRTGQVELALLRLDGAIAGYVVALLDAGSYRVFDGHFDTRFARYSPGRIIEAAALQRVVEDPAMREVDWMSGVAPEKILFSNGLEERRTLVASVGATGRPKPKVATGLTEVG